MKSVPLNDTSNFELISGLWKGARGPLKSTRVLRSTNFAGDGLLDFDDVVELEVENRHFASRQLQPGDIIIECSGGGPKQPVGRAALFVPFDDHMYFSSNFTTTIRIQDQPLFNPGYIALYLHALYLDGATETLQRATTGIRNLDWREYLRIEVPAHPLQEQQSLAHLIIGVRTAYRNEQHLCQTFMALKRSALSSIFTHGLRGEAQKDTEIGPMPIDWTVERLDACARVVSTRMSYTELEVAENTTETPENAVRVIGIKVSDMNHAGNETVLVRTALEKALDATQATHQCAPPGTIVFPKRGAAIATNKKRLTDTWSVFDPNVIGVVPGGSINPRFLFQWFQFFDLKGITESGPTPQLNK
ncbi:restriction endonuclease subunit S [Xylella fastidiosa subsp. multiplex]|nr:restriction endonuclease subunit S [Xylella fastidiosa]QTX30198.1 restriction endonuclease subunit S [Xylella fastidiosa subsp. multiplex]TNV92075.1 restriction endonuclease subunit S [Xylella fastidiosa]